MRLVTLGIQAVGTALHERLVARGMGGSGMRTQANYDGWWNGGMRNTCTYHNTIAMLTEIIGNPTPMEIPLIPEKQLYISDLPLPIAPQPWHFHQTIEYLMETNRAMLDYASRQSRDAALQHLANGHELDRTGQRGLLDYHAEAHRSSGREAAGAGSVRSGRPVAGAAVSPPRSMRRCCTTRRCAIRAATSCPPIRLTFLPRRASSTRCSRAGITVLQARSAFQVAGRSYPAGSYVVKTAQAFRPMVRDMFEPQDHPRDDLLSRRSADPAIRHRRVDAGDAMGVQYDRVLDGFDGPFVKLNGLQKPMPRGITGPANPAGYLISHRSNYSFTLVNRLLKANAEVYWLKGAAKAGGEDLGTGAIWMPASPARARCAAQRMRASSALQSTRWRKRRPVKHCGFHACASAYTISTAA